MFIGDGTDRTFLPPKKAMKVDESWFNILNHSVSKSKNSGWFAKTLEVQRCFQTAYDGDFDRIFIDSKMFVTQWHQPSNYGCKFPHKSPHEVFRTKTSYSTCSILKWFKTNEDP